MSSPDHLNNDVNAVNAQHLLSVIQAIYKMLDIRPLDVPLSELPEIVRLAVEAQADLADCRQALVNEKSHTAAAYHTGVADCGSFESTEEAVYRSKTLRAALNGLDLGYEIKPNTHAHMALRRIVRAMDTEGDEG